MSVPIQVGHSYLPLFHHGPDAPTFVVIEGPRGTAKTRSVLTVIMSRALAYPGSRWLLARSKRTRLSQSVLKTLEEQVFPAFGMPVPGGAGTTNRTEYILPNGSQLVPLGLDDYQRTQSVEVAGIYVAEGVEIKERETVLALAGAMRQDIPGLKHQCIVDCNPGAPAHWLNQVSQPVPKSIRHVQTVADYQRLLAFNRSPASPGKWKRIVTKIQDNVGYFDLQNWVLRPLGRAYLDTLSHLTGHLRRQWIDGDWVAAEGIVYPEFDADRHVIPYFPIPRDWPCILAEDPGFDHPTAIIVAAVAPYSVAWQEPETNKEHRVHKLFFCGEIVRRNTSVEQDADDIRKLLMPKFNIVKMLGDPHYMFSRNKHNSGVTIAAQMRKFGHRFVPAPAASSQADIAAQVELVRFGLRSSDERGEPLYQVFDTCPYLINSFQTWGYERNAAGEITGGEDRFAEEAKDEMDATRMIVSSRPAYRGPKVEIYG